MNAHTPQLPALPAPTRNLQGLSIIRVIVWIGEAAATAYAFWGIQLPLPYPALITVLTISLLITAASLLRLRYPWPVTELEFFAHLLSDTCILSALLYFTGGATNPFVSYLLVPLTISAATLSWRYTCAIMAVSLAAYSWLLFYYTPVELLAPQHGSHAGLNWHIVGMWINFVVSAGLITFFVVRMAHSLRQRDKALQATREKHLRNEHVIGIATMAANTAHALGTPLSTMAVLLNEMAHAQQNQPQLQQDLHVLKQQVDACKNNLRQLMQTAERLQQTQHESIGADQFIAQLLDSWRSARPSVPCTLTFDAATSPLPLSNSPNLAQAIQNLLDNAADASPQGLQVTADWDNTAVTLRIRDFGPGIPLDLADRLGQPFFTTKSKGLGLGLFLSHATLDQFGGRIHLFNHADGGTLTEVYIPVIKNNG
jgi:two-component system sensor histidine kinase RegB